MFLVFSTHFLAFSFALINVFLRILDYSPVNFLKCECDHKKFHNAILSSYDNKKVPTYFDFIYKVVFTLTGYACFTITTFCYYVIYKIIRTKQFIRLKLNGMIAIKTKATHNRKKSIAANLKNNNNNNNLIPSLNIPSLNSPRTSFNEILSSTLLKATNRNNNQLSVLSNTSTNLSKSNMSIDFKQSNNIINKNNSKISLKNEARFRKFSLSEPHLNMCDSKTDKSLADCGKTKPHNFYSLTKLKEYKVSSINLSQNEVNNEHKVTIISFRNQFDTSSIYFARSRNSCTKNVKCKKHLLKKSGTSSMESKAIKKTLIPIVVFYCFWSPFAFLKLYSLVTYAPEFTSSTSMSPSSYSSFFDKRFFEYFYLTTISIALCHSSINPIVYCITNVEIRKAMNVRVRNFVSFVSLKFPFCFK